MGGTGSGRWNWHDKKATVEDCLILNASKLARDGTFSRQPGGGWLSWTSTATGETTASLKYSREVVDERVVLHLRYTVGRRGGEKHDIDEAIMLQSTPLAIGGIRWWFVCPLIVNSYACARRVGKLYLPPGERYFGCRHCYALTYTSCQDSHRYDRLFRNLATDTGVDERLVKTMFSCR